MCNILLFAMFLLDFEAKAWVILMSFLSWALAKNFDEKFSKDLLAGLSTPRGAIPVKPDAHGISSAHLAGVMGTCKLLLG